MRSILLSEKEAEKLKKTLQQKEIETEKGKSKYEEIRIDHKNLFLILYSSLKLVYKESSEMDKILTNILDKPQKDTIIIGADEVGKGEWYGPLVVVAVALEPEQINQLRLMGVQDSKKMNLSKINTLAKRILKNYGMLYRKVILKPKKYNELYFDFSKENKNLNDLLAWAHSKAIQEVVSEAKKKYEKIKIIVDKFDFEKLDLRLRKIKKNNIEIIQKTHGESELPVALASILAKHFFEKEIINLNYKFNIDLKNESPDKLSKEVLFNVAKIHFRNVEF